MKSFIKYRTFYKNNFGGMSLSENYPLLVISNHCHRMPKTGSTRYKPFSKSEIIFSNNRIFLTSNFQFRQTLFQVCCLNCFNYIYVYIIYYYLGNSTNILNTVSINVSDIYLIYLIVDNINTISNI